MTSRNGSTEASSSTAHSPYPASGSPAATSTRLPSSEPAAWASPISPLTRPRCVTGTWSGTAASRPVNTAEAPSCTAHQPTSSPVTSVAWLSPSRLTAATATPLTSHGLRGPYREVVRSESRPHTMCPTSSTSEPAPVTRPSAFSFSSGANRAAWVGSSRMVGPK